MQVRMINGCFGFEKGLTYSAMPNEGGDGYIVMNGVYKGFVFNEDVEVVE